MPITATCMDLEIVKLSEVRQIERKKKKKHTMYRLYAESLKRLQMNLSTKQT